MKETIYKIIDVFTGGTGLSKRIHGIKVKLPTRYINYFPSDYEKENFDFLKKHVNEGDIVLDIGAHIGLFSVIASRLTGPTGKVFAFEPSGVTHSLLNKTISINGISNIISVNAAVGAAPGEITFYVSPVKGDNSNSLVSYKTDRELIPEIVKLYSVDAFVEEKGLKEIRFMKIDVEGAEYDALRGAERTLREIKPVCTLGIHPEAVQAKGDRLGDIYDFVQSCGYILINDNRKIDRDEFIAETGLVDFHMVPHD